LGKRIKSEGKVEFLSGGNHKKELNTHKSERLQHMKSRNQSYSSVERRGRAWELKVNIGVLQGTTEIRLETGKGWRSS